MAEHKYWRAIGLFSQVQASSAPTTGALNNLQDDDAATWRNAHLNEKKSPEDIKSSGLFV